MRPASPLAGSGSEAACGGFGEIINHFLTKEIATVYTCTNFIDANFDLTFFVGLITNMKNP